MFQKAIKPVFRFTQDWSSIGKGLKPKDTRTQEEIISTINYFIDKSPELKKFAKDIKEMDPKHLSLVSDTLELSNKIELLPTAINMKKVNHQTGKSLIETLLEVYPKASKENPGALEFAQEVINNTDSITSKYFLGNLMGVIDDSRLSSQFNASKFLVKDIAEQTLDGPYVMDYSKQKNFMSFVEALVNPASKVEKIELLPKLLDTIDAIPGKVQVMLDDFVRSDAPTAQVVDNIKTLPQVANLFHANGKTLDVVDFATKNVNLV